MQACGLYGQEVAAEAEAGAGAARMEVGWRQVAGYYTLKWAGCYNWLVGVDLAVNQVVDYCYLSCCSHPL